MALTRHRRSDLDLQQSRRLRSRNVPLASPTQRLRIRRSQQGRTLRLGLPSQQPEAHCPDSGSLILRDEADQMQPSVKDLCELQPTKTGHIAHQGFISSKITVQRDLISPKDVGPPADQAWGHFAATDCRLCLEHGTEWLLCCNPRWMRADDFNTPFAKTKLEDMLQRYEQEPHDFEMLNHRLRSECSDSLWSQIDTVIKRAKWGDEDIYLIRWKSYWTPQSNIDDLNWALSSIEAVDALLERRRSDRVKEKAPGLAVKMEAKIAAFKQIDELS